MADYVTAIRTADGDKKIDYNALANKPTVSSLGAVPNTTTVNGKPLSGNISLTASDVNAVPKTTKVNGKALSGNISLTANDVGALTQVFSIGTKAPSNTKLLWIDTTANTGGLKYHNGTSWVHVPVAYV